MGDKGRIRGRILALSGLVPWLVSLPAQAEPRDFGPFDVVGAGKLAETWITLLPLATGWTDATAQERWTVKRPA